MYAGPALFIALTLSGKVALFKIGLDMSRLTPQQEKIFNAGERLIPGVTHDVDEEIRHRSSYLFFRKIIESDLASQDTEHCPVTILDLGCGTGHGSRELAEITGSRVTGVDVSADSISYAKENYSADNINYVVTDMEQLVAKMPVYDYIVSRHAIEHVPDGLNRCLSLKWTKRMMINVPYNEPPGNEFHLMTGITKESYSNYKNAEFFYEDLSGLTYADEKHQGVNSIICVSSNSAMPPVSQILRFPFSAWKPSELQAQGYRLNNLEDHLETRLAQLDIRLAQMGAQLNEISMLPSVRVERKIRRMIHRLLSK